MARKRPNGSGMNPRKRPDGRWEARVFVLTTEGTWKRVSVYGKSPEAVEAKATELKGQRDKGIPAASTTSTVRDYLQIWLEESVRPNRRPSTYEGYEINVRCHINPFIGGKKLARLSVRDVQAWLGQLRAAGRSKASIRYAHRTLRAALNQAVRTELIARNVALHVELPSIEDDDDGGRQALTPAHAKLLLQRAGGQRLYAAYVLGLLGLRRGEVLGLRWEDVDLVQRTIKIRQTVHRSGGALHVGPPKSRRSRRTIPLPLFAVAALRTQFVFQAAERDVAGDKWQESGRVLSSPIGTILDPRNFQREWEAFRDGIEGLPKVTFHELRHSLVSLLTELGVPPRVIMEIAGHAGLDVTMRVYSHVRLEAQRVALDQLGTLFGDHADGGDEH